MCIVLVCKLNYILIIDTMHTASFLKIKSPTPYALRNSTEVQYGMNFAHGGTGIFNTLVDGPNMTVQIDSFEKLIKQELYTRPDLESSIALVNAAGNDYATFALKNGSIQVSLLNSLCSHIGSIYITKLLLHVVKSRDTQSKQINVEGQN